jgi:Flp pilus assembly protein TadG
MILSDQASPTENKFMNTRKVLLNKRGQSIVELSLITPLLLAALYVAMDFGTLYFKSQYAQNAVREGARIAAVLPDCSTGATTCVGTIAGEACPGAAAAVKEVCDRLSPLILTEPVVAVTLTGNIGSPCMREVAVSVTGTYDFGLYNVMALIGMPIAEKTLTLTRTAGARYQGQPVTWTGTSC